MALLALPSGFFVVALSPTLTLRPNPSETCRETQCDLSLMSPAPLILRLGAERGFLAGGFEDEWPSEYSSKKTLHGRNLQDHPISCGSVAMLMRLSWRRHVQ